MDTPPPVVQRIRRAFALAQSREDAIARALRTIEREHLHEEFVRVVGPYALLKLLDEWTAPEPYTTPAQLVGAYLHKGDICDHAV